jgi:hypothetical protein
MLFSSTVPGFLLIGIRCTSTMYHASSSLSCVLRPEIVAYKPNLSLLSQISVYKSNGCAALLGSMIEAGGGAQRKISGREAPHNLSLTRVKLVGLDAHEE